MEHSRPVQDCNGIALPFTNLEGIHPPPFGYLLRHIQQRLIVVEPQVVVGDAHLVECDFLGVLEEAIRPPDVVQPVDIENSVILAHVLRQSEPGVSPALCQEDVGDVSLRQVVQNIKTQQPKNDGGISRKT